MDRFDAMRVFARVVERRSFSRAAQDLGLPRSTVTDAVKQLEARLGVQLLRRTTRHVLPTLDGETYHQRCVALIADLEDAEASFRGANPSGTLRIEVQGTIARHFLLPRLPDFLERHPGIELFMSESDGYVDPVREGFDCVLRGGELGDSDLVARRLVSLAAVTCASPDYLARHGRPARADALEGQRMVGYHSAANGGLRPLRFTAGDAMRTVVLPATISVNGAESAVAAARAGLGLIQVPRFHVQADLDRGALVEVLADTPPPPLPVSLLYARSRLLAPRVRVFIDWLTRKFEAACR